MAELTDRPFPPGSYPVIVVGSGPGGLQVSYSLSRYGIDHAMLSADEAPGGMFRRWPFFQRLLSWTKPYAPVPHDHPAYQRYDWNSLLADEPENQAIMPGLMDGYSYFPSRPEMQQNLETFASRTGIAIRHGCRWTGTRREPAAGGGEEFVVETSDGEYRAPIVIFAVGVAEPAVPDTPGIEFATHYAGTRPAETYADKRVFIIGKQNSGFELASGLLQWARDDHARVAFAGEALGQHEVARRRPGALRPAGRGPRPGRRGDDPRRVDRTDRAARGRWLRSRRPTLGRRRRDALRGRRGDRRDRVPWPRSSTCPSWASRRSARAGCRR